jgi:flagellar protein FlaG
VEVMLDRVSNTTKQLPIVKVEPVENVGIVKVKQVQPETVLTKEKAEKVVNSVNEFLKGTNTQLAYRFHEGLNEYYAVVVDDVTNRVVKEIPSRKLLDIYAAMKEYTGIFVDKKA